MDSHADGLLYLSEGKHMKHDSAGARGQEAPPEQAYGQKAAALLDSQK